MFASESFLAYPYLPYFEPGTRGSQESGPDPLDLELEMMSKWVLGANQTSSATKGRAFSCCAVSPAPGVFFCFEV